MKTKKLTIGEALKAIENKPSRIVGKWAEICNEVKKSHAPVEVSEITRGQVAALARKARDSGLRCATWYKEGKCIVLPAEE